MAAARRAVAPVVVAGLAVVVPSRHRLEGSVGSGRFRTSHAPRTGEGACRPLRLQDVNERVKTHELGRLSLDTPNYSEPWQRGGAGDVGIRRLVTSGSIPDNPSP